MAKPVSKVTFILALILGMCLFPDAFAQQPAFKANVKKSAQDRKLPSKNEKDLTEILVHLELVYDVTFAYQKKYLSGKSAVLRPLLGVPLDEYLSEILPELNLGFKKIGEGSQVIYVLQPLEEVAVRNTLVNKSDTTNLSRRGKRTITGVVRNSLTGAPIAGVNIYTKDISRGTLTDAEGNFSLTLPDTLTSERLTFSHVGFHRLEVPITDENVIVELEESTRSLSELVITAMGIQRGQKALGYSVTSLPASEINSSAATNFASAMYGKVPGVRIRTAPGGATSAVTMQIRGFNSLNYNTQPFYIVDGVPIRDSNEKGAAGVNNDHYFTDPRIRGNGILDISPSDIETITILKGASATALYGSDASNGAVVITTRKGLPKKGMGIDVNYSFTQESAAFLPKYQNTYGPGYDRETNLTLGATPDGWLMVDTDRDGIGDTKSPVFRAYAQFGPRMDGQEVLWWDGAMRSYSPQPDNLKDFYRNGYSSQFNVSLQDQVEHARYRVSYSRHDYEGIQVGGALRRNTLNSNTSFRLSKKMNVDWMLNLSNASIHNRPSKINRLTDSYSGFFSRAERMSLFFDKYQTSDGFKWIPPDQAQRNPDEALKYVVPRGAEVMNLLWRQLRDSEDEIQNRAISSVTLNYSITDHLSLRGRGGIDYTDHDAVTKEHNEYPTEFNSTSSTGTYREMSGDYLILYGDALMMYSKRVNPDFAFDVNVGFQVRDERYRDNSVATNGGLKEANVFELSNSYYPQLNHENSKISVLKFGYLGIASMNYKDVLFVETTGRQEYSSTLPPGRNRYFYPSINSGLVFSNMITLPSFFDFGKLRASYGVVGNSPPVYEANVRYDSREIPSVNGNVNAGSPNGALYGNHAIKPERKYEVELGLDLKMFRGKVGVDLTWYNNRIKDQILRLDLPTSTGARKILTNVGELRGHGYEAGISAALLRGPLSWKTSINAAYATTKVQELLPGVNQLVFRDLEGSSILVVAEKGEDIGNIYVYPRKKDENGNLIINQDGLYIIDKSRYVKAGNVLPKITGGIINSFSYKSFTLTTLVDYSFGGKMISPSQKYNIGSGMYETTMRYRDAKNGGLSYYINDIGEKVLLPESGAPEGYQVYHDGVILKGVTEEGMPNHKIIEAAYYYINTFGWGNDAWNEGSALFDNDYIKMREVVLTWSLPKSIASRIHAQRLQFSLVGRNLFYLWRTMENADPESSIGTTWVSQGIDEGSNAATRSYGFTLNASF